MRKRNDQCLSPVSVAGPGGSPRVWEVDIEVRMTMPPSTEPVDLSSPTELLPAAP